MLKPTTIALGSVLSGNASNQQKGVLIAQPFSIASSVLAHQLATWYSQGRSDDVPQICPLEWFPESRPRTHGKIPADDILQRGGVFATAKDAAARFNRHAGL